MSLPNVAAFYASLPTKRVTAGVLITDDADRVLLLQPSYTPTWEVPGGGVEAGESPRAAARRHVGEELGFDPGIGRLLVVDWVPEEPPKTEAVAFLYDGGTLDPVRAAGIRLHRADLNAYGFVDLEGAMGLVSDRAERRVKAALAARRSGRLLELEDGWRQELEPANRATSPWSAVGR
jgi:ADP-ribose pyrophosphatase YjhB (NUDIX family)